MQRMAESPSAWATAAYGGTPSKRSSVISPTKSPTRRLTSPTSPLGRGHGLHEEDPTSPLRRASSGQSGSAALSPRKWAHPELEVLNVRYRTRRSVLHVYAASLWIVLAAIVYAIFLRPEAKLFLAGGGLRALAVISVLFCFVSAALCLYNFFRPLERFVGTDMTPHQRALAGLPPLSEAELAELRNARAREPIGLLEHWAVWPTLRDWGAASSHVRQPLRAQSFSLTPPVSPHTAPVPLAQPTLLTSSPSSAAAAATAQSPVRSPRSKVGLIRNARDMHHVLMAEERKLMAQEPLVADEEMPMASFGTSAAPAYRLAQRSKNDDAPFAESKNSTEPFAGERGLQLSGRVRNVDKDIDAWAMNMRKWLAVRVFRALVNRMDDVGKYLSQYPGAAIGGSWTRHQVEQQRDHLRQQFITAQQQKNELLLWDERVRIEQYLDMPGCKNKGYLLKRIRELADGNLSYYRWNAGGEFRGKPWTAEWPTDAQIVYHVFSTFMDINMPCLYNHVVNQQGQRSECNHKPFTDNYTRSKDNINAPVRDTAMYGDLCIYQQEDYPQPRFTVLVRTQDSTQRQPQHKALWRQYMQIEPGRQNLFHALCVFVFYVEVHLKGYLGYEV